MQRFLCKGHFESPILLLDPKPWRIRGEGWGRFWWERGGTRQRARGSRHQGMGVGTGYIAKGFNLFKKKNSPQIPMTLTEAEQRRERG